MIIARRKTSEFSLKNVSWHGFSNYFVQYLIPDSEDDVGVCAVFGVVDGVSGGF